MQCNLLKINSKIDEHGERSVEKRRRKQTAAICLLCLFFYQAIARKYIDTDVLYTYA